MSDSYFFDSPGKAFLKASFAFLTYVTGILFKSFTVSTVLPTVTIYFLSNMPDYCFIPKNTAKTTKIRRMAVAIAVFFGLGFIFSFSALTANNSNITNFIEQYFGLIYLCTSPIWAIPFLDGICSINNEISRTAPELAQNVDSRGAYNVMRDSVDVARAASK